MRFIQFWSIPLLLILSVIYSCKEDTQESYFLKLETISGNKAAENLDVEANGISQSFSVKSNGPWKITSTSTNASNWISVSPSSGNGNGTFNLLIEKNETLSTREAKLSCSVNGEETVVLTIRQKSRQPSLSVKLTSLETIKNTGGFIEFTVEADTEWKYTISEGSWLTEKSKTSTSLTLEASENKTTAERKAIVLFSLSSISEVTQNVVISQEKMEAPFTADLFDIVFKADGTAEDISTASYTVSTVEGMSMTTVYSNRYERYIARFNHNAAGSVSSGYYERDYSNDQKFKDALSSGHTLEAIFMLDLDSPLPNLEIKMFSSHQSGGTGLMIGNNSRGNSIIFLPHVGGKYIWANSNIVPERGKYYHVVGVWNKEEGNAHVYVDGVLKGSVSASGNFQFPSAGSNWFCVGADPGGATAHSGWKGDVVLSRIYDKPLNKKDVDELWNQVKDFKPISDDIELSGISLFSKRVQTNSEYTIIGEGFQTGDRIKITPISGTGKEYLLDGTVAANSLTLTIPGNFETGKYRFLVIRGSKELDIGFATLTVGEKPLGEAQVIAHRGHWKPSGSAQNSVASLVKAQELDIYGSEFDVWITTDDVVVLNHDPTIGGIRIETSTFDDLKNIRLSNGEKIPTLTDYLVQGKKDPTTKLILEIKTHSASQGGVNNNDRVAKAVVDMVKEANMIDQVEYIAFSLDVCKELLRLQPNALVAYLNGNIAPKGLYDMGIIGIDYNISVIRNNLGWISEAHDLGMTVNVWTVNSENDLQEMIDLGVDFITTDEPVLAKQLIERN